MAGLSTRKKMNKRIKLVLPAVSIVLLITLLSAFLCTYLMKENKVKEFKKETESHLSFFRDHIELNHASELDKKKKWLSEGEIVLALSYQATNSWDKKEEYYDYAVVLYDSYSDYISCSDNRVAMINKNGTRVFYLSDYLNKDEILSLSEELKRTIYPEENSIYMSSISFDKKGTPVLLGFFKRHTNGINAVDNSWKTGTDENTDTSTASAWISNNDVKSIVLNNGGEISSSVIVSFYSPIYTIDEKQWVKRWTAWMNNDVLQSELLKAKERIKETETNSFSSDSLLVYDQNLLYQSIENGQKNYEKYGNMIFIATYRPWLSAMKELKTIYLLEALLCALSIYIVTRNILKTYDKQKELDDTKNSFITAMAHDLKTPLTVIKGYSENLLDNEDQEKRDDFLHKIINKTDEVNDMVGNMLDLSRIDSGGFELQREEVILNELLFNIFERYLSAMEEKRLRYTAYENGKFVVIGDERYLEKMLGNLIDNAISYAKEDSKITVEIDQNSLVMSNKSDSIPEEKLKHIFEFSSGSKGHYGFGLYFAKKVADIHNLLLSVENDAEGVKVSISKK